MVASRRSRLLFGVRKKSKRVLKKRRRNAQGLDRPVRIDIAKAFPDPNRARWEW